MKRILFLVTIIITETLFSQTLDDWTGTWEWQSGNQTFQLYTLGRILNDSPSVSIKFRMIEDDNEIYSTRFSNGEFEWYWPLGFDSNMSNVISVLFMDFTHDGDFKTYKNGVLKLYYQDCDTSGCQPTLSWKLRPPKDAIAPQGSPEEFNLPTDIILTKVE